MENESFVGPDSVAAPTPIRTRMASQMDRTVPFRR